MLTGFGARWADWNGTHTFLPDEGGKQYGPLLAGDDEHPRQGTYSAVSGKDRVDVYYLNFGSALSLESAKARVARELPPDAREAGTKRRRECVMVNYRSPTLERIFRGQAGNGVVQVGFFSEDPDRFAPTKVTLAVFSFYFGPDVGC